MSINVNEIKERVEVICAKDQKTIYLNDVKFNKYAAMAQDKIIIEQRRMPSKDFTSSDALSDLKINTSVNVDPTTGEYVKPTNFLYYGNMWIQTFQKNKRGKMFNSVNVIDKVEDNELPNRETSLVSTPTESHPIVVEYDTYFKFFPSTVGNIKFTYLKEPATPVWAFTIVNNEQVYDSGSSVDFELPYQFKDDLIWNICSLLGVTVRQADLIQASQALNPRG
jgi:hypothetical protein